MSLGISLHEGHEGPVNDAAKPVAAAGPTYPESWRGRWSRWALASALDPLEPVVVALSGGADSVFLLHTLCAARERPPLEAVHVHHGLRGEEADQDARFCVELGRELGVPVRVRRIDLAPGGPSLEARARELRYGVLVEEARRLHARVIATGHHADDGLETLLMRWIRGADLGGLAGPRRVLERGGRLGALRVVRPLLSLRRAEIRRLLEDAGLRWREDGSNDDRRFSRNRVRQVLLPRLEQLGGAHALERLRDFAAAVAELERELAELTAELSWSTTPGARASRTASTLDLGGVLPRARLMALPMALRRRALWRLIVEGTSRGPSRRVLELITADLAAGRTTRHTLGRGWQLRLGASTLALEPPPELLQRPARAVQAWLPFPELRGELELPRARVAPWVAALADPPHGFALPVPGSVCLPDGRRLVAEVIEASPLAPIARDPLVAELDLARASGALSVRWPRPGDRFHPLGAPGTRALRRVLADAGVPRSERRRVVLVSDDSTILWVTGVRTCEHARVASGTTRRLRLSLVDPGRARERAGAALDERVSTAPPAAGLLPFSRADGASLGSA